MGNLHDRFHCARFVRPDKEDIGAWIAAVLGMLFTLAIMFWPGGWSGSTQMTRMASNTTVIAKTDPNQPPPKTAQP